ncbi:photosynthetic complex putative assembly protein PuhB [Afipia sp. DC4300-2b1]|uniref:photosynthetic complex putative assembly protein PuhB n=1 Tax=Afipia sp. DC4300-2b1 TaxID=2804672 RepID=UPI003CE744CB
MKHDPGQFQKLPSPLPAGERVVWQGRPTFKGLALRAFHIREVGIYFGLLLMWRLWSNWSNGASLSEATTSALWLIAPAISGIAILAVLAWLFRRSSCYTITNRHVLLHFGVALPITMTIPLTKIASAALRTYRDGSGDIPLKLADHDRASYLLLWPHIRPWRLRLSEPMLRSVPDAALVAARLAEVLSGQPGPVAVSLSRLAQDRAPVSAVSHSPTTAAA